MRKTVALILCFCMALMLIPLGGCSKFSQMTASEILDAFIEANYPIGYRETSLANSLGAYSTQSDDTVLCLSTIEWADTRLGQEEDTLYGGEIEVFTDEEDAQARFSFMMDFFRDTPGFAEYTYVIENVVLYVHPMLGADAAQGYCRALCQLAKCNGPSKTYTPDWDPTRTIDVVDSAALLQALQDAGYPVYAFLPFADHNNAGFCTQNGICWTDEHSDAMQMMFCFSSSRVAEVQMQVLQELEPLDGCHISKHGSVVLVLEDLEEEQIDYYEDAVDDYLAQREIEPYGEESQQDTDDDGYRMVEDEVLQVEDISFARPEHSIVIEYYEDDVLTIFPSTSIKNMNAFVTVTCFGHALNWEQTPDHLLEMMQNQFMPNDMNYNALDFCQVYSELDVPALYFGCVSANGQAYTIGYCFWYKDNVYYVMALSTSPVAEDMVDYATDILSNIQFN